MKKTFHKRSFSSTVLLCLTGILLGMLGLVFSLAVRPVQASPLPQAGYPVGTPSVTVTATANGTTTVTPTPTNTLVGTLPAPARTGTPTALVPVTGGDFTQPGGGANVGTWIAIWLLGLILIGFGLLSRLNKGQP
jgi:hypothetical protein